MGYSFLLRSASNVFARLSVFVALLFALQIPASLAQVGTLPTLVSPVNGQTIPFSGTTTYRITVSNQSGTPYLYFFYVQRGMTPDPNNDLALASPVFLVEAQNGVNYSWPSQLPPGTYNVYVFARPTSGSEPSNISNVVTVNVVGGGSDTTPDPFSFPQQTNLPRSSTCTTEAALGRSSKSSLALRSRTNSPIAITRKAGPGPGLAGVTITGINAPTNVSVSGASGSEININGRGWVTSGTINNNEQLDVRHTTSSAFNTATSSTVDVGGVTATFFCTTELEDTTPDQFSIPALINQPLNAFCSAQTDGLTGINSPVIATIDGTGEILTSTGTWAKSVLVGLTDRILTVRQLTSTLPGTLTTAVLNIGGVTAPFTCTTAAAADTTPDPFSFTTQTGVALSTLVTSNTITITGIDTSSPISILNGEYSINGGAFTSASGTLPFAASAPAPTVQVRHTSAAALGANTVTTLTIGGVSGTFTSTTTSVDTTPDPFSFTTQTGVALATSVVSNTITITGINTDVPISVVNGEYSINNSPFTSTPSNLLLSPGGGPQIRVRHSSAATPGTNTVTTLTIGGVNGTFTSTTVGADTTPNPFSFTTQTGVALSALVVSNVVTITGTNNTTPISISNGEYSINGGAFTSAASGLFPPTDNVSVPITVQVRHTAASTPGTDTITTLSIGGVNGTFTSTTIGPDTTPDAITFAPVRGVRLSTLVESATQTITGINTAVNVGIVGGEYSLNGGAYTSAAGTATAGTTVRVRQTSAAAPGTDTITTLTVGTLQTTFVTTTEGIDTTPDAIAFAEQLGVEPGIEVRSNAQTITGINTPVNVSVQGGEFAINGAAFRSTATTANNGDSIIVRHTTNAGFNAAVVTTLNVGTIATTFRSVTRTQSPGALPSIRIFDPVNGTSFTAFAPVPVNVAVEDPSGNAQIQTVRISMGNITRTADASAQACPSSTTGLRCVVYRTAFGALPAGQYTISANVDYVSGGQTGSAGAASVSIFLTPATSNAPSDIVAAAALPRIVPGANVTFAVRAVDGRGSGIANIPLRWTIIDSNAASSQKKAACANSPTDTPNTQAIQTDASGVATIAFKASCSAGGRELSVVHDVPNGVSRRFQLVGPNQSASDVSLVGFNTNAALLLGATTELTARVTDGTNVVNGAITTWALSPAGAGTVQSPVQTDERGEAKSSLVLSPNVASASLTLCIEGRTSSCKTYTIRSATAAITTPATSTVNALTQQSITAPRVQINLMRDRMQQLRNEQTSGFYNGVGLEVPGGRVSTDGATGGKEEEKDKAPSRVSVPKNWGSFALGDVTLGQKQGQVGFDVSTRGLTFGVDYRFSQEWVAGAALGYSYSKTELNIGGEQRARNVSGSVFAQWLPSNNAYVNVAANTGRGSYKLERPTSDLSVARASPKGQQAAGQVEVGYMWSNGAYRLQPFVRGELSRATIDPILETGAAEALEIEKQRVRASTLSAGLVADYTVSTRSGVFIPSARVELYRESQKINDSFARLANGSPVVVPLTSDPIDKNYGTVGANLQWIYGILGTPISSFVGYEHTFGKSGTKIGRILLGVKIPLR
jgi:uncharacterized protein with beta-barrel porin domain/predicted thioesterase